MTALIVLSFILAALGALAGLRWRRRRQTVWVRMSDMWLREHADDPVPEHLR